MNPKDNTPTTDEERRQAITKKITLQPLHNDIAPEDLPNAEVAAHHIIRGALPNAENDTEQSKPLIKPSESVLHQAPHARKPHYRTFIIAFIAGLISVTLIGYLLMYL